MKKYYEKLKQKFNIIKAKFTNNKVNNKLTKTDDTKKLLIIAIFGACVLFPQILIATLSVGIGYLVFKDIYPIFKNWNTKIKSFISKNLKKFKEKKVEKETHNEEKEKTEKKSIKNVIKNFKLYSFNKLKGKLTVKRDINGHKIVNGSYRIKGNNIIDNKTYISFTTNENTDSKEKVYTKTK